MNRDLVITEIIESLLVQQPSPPQYLAKTKTIFTLILVHAPLAQGRLLDSDQMVGQSLGTYFWQEKRGIYGGSGIQV